MCLFDFDMRETDFAKGVLTVVVWHCAMCAIRKVPHPYWLSHGNRMGDRHVKTPSLIVSNFLTSIYSIEDLSGLCCKTPSLEVSAIYMESLKLGLELPILRSLSRTWCRRHQTVKHMREGILKRGRSQNQEHRIDVYSLKSVTPISSFDTYTFHQRKTPYGVVCIWAQHSAQGDIVLLTRIVQCRIYPRF